MVSYTIKQTVVENLNADLDGKQPAGDYPTNASLTESLQSNLLNYTTNRILEIPQDIKLELNNGTLTLKAGSKVYVPNGAGVFNQITMANDKVLTQNWTNTDSAFLAWYDNSLTLRKITDVCSGPTDTISGRFHWWYDTTNNVIKEIETDGTARTTKLCLPIAVLKMVGDNTATVVSIDQVFNGLGYIGSTLFLLPGVKTVVPDGRNENGTCKNKAPSTVSSVKTETISRADTAYMFTNYASSVIAIHHYICSKTKPTVPTTTLWYNPETNLPSQVLSDGTVMTPYKEIPLAKFTSDSTGKITSFEPYTVDSIANSNASNFSQAGRSYLSGLGMPSVKSIKLTVGASGATYTAPANGWFYICVQATGRGAFYNMYDTNIGCGVMDSYLASDGSYKALMPIIAGNTMCFSYSYLNLTTDSSLGLWFYYAQGEQ